MGWLPPDMVPAERVEYHAADGWTAGVRHYPGDGPPVLLVHGMAANHYNFDYRADRSLVTWLQARHWDVWVAELRGDPESVPPDPKARGYSLDDHALYDLPAILDVVRDRTGEAQVYWVGHSMGGILLYTALELYPERIAAGVAVASPTDLHDRDGLLGLARRFDWLLPKRHALPAQSFGRGMAWMGRTNPLFGVLANKRNLDWPLANGLARYAMEDVPGRMQAQVSAWLRTGVMTREDGSPWFVRNDRPEVPLLVTGGARDQIVPLEDARSACSVFPACTFVELSAANGYSADYGHVDPILGPAAATEVYPVIGSFLDAHRP